MKKTNYIFTVAMAAILLGACTEKKKSNIIIAKKSVAMENKGTQKMSNYEQSRDVEWLGSSYQVVVKRSSAADLPLVTLDDDMRYYDNKITVRILRKDGSEFFNHTFTKTDFTSFIDKHTQDTGALLGVVYVKAEGDNLYFAASVGSPDITSDEYVPLMLKVSRMGDVSISKDQVLDTDSEPEHDEEEGV